MPASENIPLFPLSDGSIFKPSAYMQFDLNQFDVNAAVNHIGPIGRVQVKIDALQPCSEVLICTVIGSVR